MFHTCNLVHLLSMDLVPCKLFNMLTIFKSFYRIFEMARECTLINKRDLVCSMIMISENAAAKITLVMDPQYNCKKQEYQEFHSITTVVICDTSMISANVGVSLEKAFSKLVLNILLTIWQYSYKAKAYSKSPQNSKSYPEHNEQ